MCGFQGRGAFIRQRAFVREGRLIQTCQLRGALIRHEAFIREGKFIRSFTVTKRGYLGLGRNVPFLWEPGVSKFQETGIFVE